MLKKARFAKPIGQVVEIESMEKPSSAKSKSGSPSRRNSSPPKSAGSGKGKKSPSPSRKKGTSPSRKGSGGELKSAMRKGSGKEKGGKKDKKKAGFKNTPEFNEDGLKIIDMSGQGMTVLPLSVLGDKQIGELILASNNLRSLPPEIKRLETMTKLDLSRNGLRCTNPNDFTGMPQEMSLLTNLVDLKISECNMPYVPPAIWKMEQLKFLDISRNKINVLAPEIGNLIYLQKLNLQQTNITTLPPEIAYCQDLEEILLWGNIIESLPETLPEMLKLRTLAINYRSFCAQVEAFQESEDLLRKGKLTSEHIPFVVFELATLEVLDLESTKINNIPDMSNISLKELYVCKNFLSKVPASLFNLNHLTTLDMSNNLLTLLPDNISSITSLKILRLSCNQIERIPPKIRELINLVELNVAENRIHYLPSAIGGLKKLESLFVEKNQLTSLPDEICDLESLQTLDITENRITALPMKMHRLQSLAVAHSFQRLSKVGLWLNKNPIVQPPPEIWKTERPEKIFDYLKKLAIIKTENLQRQKMLVFGQSGSGKTSLIKGLVHRKSMMTAGDAEKTKALEQTPWKTDNNVEFLINDFGGDKEYTMIYPLFADNNAMAVVVYNHHDYTNETHDTAIGDWLEFLNIYMPGAVVKIIGTHLDDYEEFAIPIELEEDENANTLSRIGSGVSRQSTRRSGRSSRSSRSINSAHSQRSRSSSINREMDEPMKEVTDESQMDSSQIGLAKIAEETVKENIENQKNAMADRLQQHLNNVSRQITKATNENKPLTYIRHLQDEKKRTEYIIEHPLRIMPEISLVSNNEGLHGAGKLTEDLELMIIDKTLFPNAQRSIPAQWNKLRATLKQHKTYYLTWDAVVECAEKYSIVDEELTKCLLYLNDTGEILWFSESPKLGHLIFQKPKVLVDLLSSLFRHDMRTFLDFDTNKIFMSKGMFKEKDFENARHLFLENGQVSRPLMNCFWFYENMNYDLFNELLDLVPLLDVCYSIPEPSIPDGKLYSYPITVLPWYNQDIASTDFTDQWNLAISTLATPTTVTTTYLFPFNIPEGVFEQLACVLQTHVLSRIDWKDTIFAFTENEIFKISLKRERRATLKETAHITLTVVNKEGNETSAQGLIKELTKEVSEVLLKIPGLIWSVEASDSLWKSLSISVGPKTVKFED